ncbi:glycosyltransferase family 2 protein [Sphingobacterium alkalisoli]|uniref:Glycosyltransferase family 2 protein n=1 Tax=Sphingobacterium alkalisoli TaxID=1874115 RepID=A0A4U0GR00_9SPHI|nr:glycosyltransferase family 2 protein [Sphingobacterium alkalisoli]TJY61365.1 glycosyltransferase family 2 protein [Sphingobacterium alkalisoli]GGH30718.1 hypothetical protein GCM10011418_42990 [Sphingobacterium alkalisoli]
MSQDPFPFISVIIPMFNRESLIADTINSVLQQTIEIPFEIIVVDDGSQDSSAKVVADIKDSRVSYCYQKNSGANRARNHGVEKARGTFVAFLDSDDTFLPNHLKQCYQQVSNSRNIVVYSKIIVDRGNGNMFTKPPRALSENEHMSEYLLCDRGFLQTSTLFMSRDLAKSVKFDEELPFGQDTDFAIRLYSHGAQFVMLDNPTVIWRDLADNKRVSSSTSFLVREAWLEKSKGIITSRADIGDRGWFVAKAYARNGKYMKAASLYLNAVTKGCYSFKLSLTIGFQIFFPPSLFRKMADVYVSKFKK